MVFREKFDYFDAKVRLAGFAHDEAVMLVDVLKNFDPKDLPARVEAMHEIENAADNLNHQLFTYIAVEFLTPIDREDIAAIALRLDDIVDYIEDVVQQLYMYDIQEIYPAAYEMAVLIEQTTAALTVALNEFRSFKKSKDLATHIIKVNDYEEEADRLYIRTIRDLYKNYANEPVFIMAWSNIFQRMERCIDACENVADMMATIALKNT